MMGMDVLDIARYLGALLLVLGLIGAAGLAARRFGLPGLAKPAAQRRLKIVETLMLSPRQKLAIIRRDDVEHLVMFGADGAAVIERAITPPQQQEPAP
ncbi:MAG: flagellar biosynthetic protein FliO [Alphaproteobacteria bacterium]|nr:flagellar biosynthetic protein FliO [Alphaproteobacteria bacterium]